MSTKTTFKRIALAVVAVMGLGVLAAGPSSAVVSALTVSVDRNGTATTTASDTSTAAIISVSGFVTSENDTLVVTVIERGSRPTAVGSYNVGTPMVGFLETTSSTSSLVNAAGGVAKAAMVGSVKTTFADTKTVGAAAFKITSTGTDTLRSVGAKFTVQLDTNSALNYGTYNYTAVVQAYSHDGATMSEQIVTADFSITVATPATVTAAASTVVDPSKTVAILTEGDTPNLSTSVNVVDSSVTGSSLADNTTVASFLVKTFNAAGTATAESVTVTMTGAGSLKLVSSSVVGNSFSLTGAGGSTEIDVIANGVAGVGSIVISTPTKTFAPKLVTFYAANPATIVPVVSKPVVATGATSGAAAIALDAKDANGNLWAGQAYLFSTDTAVATAGACAWDGTLKLHLCSVTGVAEGQSKFRVGNASTLALSTVAIAEFNGPRVSTQVPASVKMEFDKATYQPGEKAKVYITVLDAAGNTLPAGTYTNVFATGGITPSLAFGAGADNGAETLTATSITTDASTSAVTLTRAGSEMYSFIMGTASGTVELTAKGGIGLPLAGQVAVTASAEVTNSAEDAANEALDAAIAATDAAILAEEAAANAEAAATAAAETAEAALDAVTALSAQVTKLVAQLASLQKLVNKIAKRVGAKK